MCKIASILRRLDAVHQLFHFDKGDGGDLHGGSGVCKLRLPSSFKNKSSFSRLVPSENFTTCSRYFP